MTWSSAEVEEYNRGSFQLSSIFFLGHQIPKPTELFSGFAYPSMVQFTVWRELLQQMNQSGCLATQGTAQAEASAEVLFADSAKADVYINR